MCSFVGRIRNHDLVNTTINFECSDGGIIVMDASQAVLPENADFSAAPVVEAITQVMDPNQVMVCKTMRICNC